MWTLLVVIFIVAGVVGIRVGGQLYKAAREAEPERYEPEYEWAARVEARPTSLIKEVASTSRDRFALLFHRSPYPEVEGLRLRCLVVLAVQLGAFVALPFSR